MTNFDDFWCYVSPSIKTFVEGKAPDLPILYQIVLFWSAENLPFNLLVN